MIRIRGKRSFKMFKLLASMVGVFFIVLSCMAIYECIETGADTTHWFIYIFFIMLGLALIIGAFFIHKLLRNDNAGKVDSTIKVSYHITYQGKTQPLENIAILTNHLNQIAADEEIIIRLTPEYFGLTDWTFIKKCNWYFSFVHIRKKNKLVQYFIMPRTDIAEVLKPFKEVFEEHKAIDTSNLISMDIYQNVLEFYKLL